MTVEEKAECFDLLAGILTNYWSNGRYSWWCPSACGGELCDTREEAVESLIKFARDRAKWKVLQEDFNRKIFEKVRA